jgi:hypothetical protein
MSRFSKLFNFRVIVVALFVFFLIEWAGEALILKLFKSAKSGIVLKERVILFETNEEILFLGSSRAHSHFVPSVFEDKLRLSCYNAGREGTGIFFHYAVLIATLERYKPKMIVLDVDFRDIYDRGGDFSENVFGQLRPYYGLINNEFDQYITRNAYDQFFNQSKLLRFNRKFLNIITANLSHIDKTTKGYKPLVGNWNGLNESAGDKNFKFSSEHVNHLEKFIVKSIENDIFLVLVISPSNKIVPTGFSNIVSRMCTQYDIPFYNFTYLQEVMRKEYFYDLEHLNPQGAKRFSEILADSLSRYIY